MIIGLLRKNEEGKYQIHLFPYEFSIEKGDIAIVITDDIDDSEKIKREPSDLFSSEPNIPKNFFQDGRFPLSKDQYLSTKYKQQAEKLKKEIKDVNKLKKTLLKKMKILKEEDNIVIDMEEIEKDIQLTARKRNTKKRKKIKAIKFETEKEFDEKAMPLGLHFGWGRHRRSSKITRHNYYTVNATKEIEEKKGAKHWEEFSGWPFTITSKKQASTLLDNHIIVCGKLNKIFWFIAALRLYHLKDTDWYRKILILDLEYLKKTNDTEHDTQVEKRLKKLSKFPDVYYYVGR